MHRVNTNSYLGRMATREHRQKFDCAVEAIVRKGRAIVTTHDVPDADGLGAAYAIREYLTRYGVRTDVVSSRLVPTTKAFIDYMRMEIKTWQQINGEASETDVPFIVVDTNTPALMNGNLPNRKPLLVIDHHQKEEPTLDGETEIINLDAISVCEIVASLIPKGGIDERVALALAVGISSDSERLAYTRRDTLAIFGQLVKRSRSPRSMIDQLAYPSVAPEMTMRTLAEIASVETLIYNGRLIGIGTTEIDPPAILASTLREANVGVVAILKQTNGGFRISIRVKLFDAYEHGVQANKIARRASQIIGIPENMWGGGHIDKAGAFMIGSYDEVKGALMAAIKEAIDNAR